MPRIGPEINRGAEGAVYENLDQAGTVVKIYYPGGTSPFQARNEFDNLEKARAVHPDNVVGAQPPADPRQGWIVKDEVIEDYPTPADYLAGWRIARDFVRCGVQDVSGNLMFGHTRANPVPRWVLVE